MEQHICDIYDEGEKGLKVLVIIDHREQRVFLIPLFKEPRDKEEIDLYLLRTINLVHDRYQLDGYYFILVHKDKKNAIRIIAGRENGVFDAIYSFVQMADTDIPEEVIQIIKDYPQ